MKLNLDKLARLEARLDADTAGLRGLNDSIRNHTRARGAALAELSENKGLAVHWRNGDDPAVILTIDPDKLFAWGVDVRIAQAVIDASARIDALRAELAARDEAQTALDRVVASCKKYASEYAS